VSRSEVDWMIKKHYLHKWPGVVVCIFGLFRDKTCVGACVYSMPSLQINKRYGCICWELARLWIVDEMPKNSETWFVAKTIMLLRKEFPQVEGIVSFADPSNGHVGTIYKAGNWAQDGMQDEERKSPRVDYWLGDKKFCRYNQTADRMKALGLRKEDIKRIPRKPKFRFFYSLRGSRFDDRLKFLRGCVRKTSP
jgi:hypothetical protein